MGWFSNETLISQDGDLSVVVYLPIGVKDDEPYYYYGSRFDHGSMIGSVTKKTHYIDREGRSKTETHVLFGTDMWRIPHNSHWPESGVGLAAEFGVGDNGAFCYYKCGWTEASDITNGVLGYAEARNGDPFLKIGVGALIKGTCPSCDSTGDYMFNSPYLFYEQPKWRMEKVGDSTVRLHHRIILNSNGYNLVKEISLVGQTLTVTSTLTNLGKEPFSTVWYSHNFFTCDGVAVGPGYGIVLDVAGEDGVPRYDEPDTWSWTSPLTNFAVVQSYPTTVRVDMVRALNPGDRIKALFKNDFMSKGSFRIEACGSSVETAIPQLDHEKENGISMYAFNLYVERGTFSPEPQILLHLNPGACTTWTQRVVFGDTDTTLRVPMPAMTAQLYLMTSIQSLRSAITVENLFAVCCLMVVGLVLALSFTSKRRQYRRIRDDDNDSDDDCSKCS